MPKQPRHLGNPGKVTNAIPKTGVVTSHSYTHSGKVVSVAGISMFHVDDQCCVLTPEGEKLAAERKAKSDGDRS
jgi:hypothetical protein